MVLDICATCGEEHEPPRGNKCKRTKLAKRAIKTEVNSGEETASEPENTAGPTAGPSAGPVLGRQEGEGTVAEIYEEDDEERALRKKLAARACEKRKQALRAALDEADAAEATAGKAARDGSAGEGASAPTPAKTPTEEKKDKKVKAEKKVTEKKTTKAESDDSSSDSSSSDDSSSDSDTDSSRSRSRSGSRRRRKKKRSKFAIARFTIDEKKVKKLSVMELVHAALAWVYKRGRKVGMEYDQLRGYVGHVAYMCMHATTMNYTDRAYRCYDKAVRQKARGGKGLKAFRMGDQKLSLLHFNLDNTKSQKEVRRPARGYGNKNSDNAKKVCYAHNYNKDGCSVRQCEYEHKCLICKSSDHTLEACKRKKY